MRLGSLFSGYGGLEMAVNAVLGSETAWVSDIDKGACKILAHRYPKVPNIGDITAVDWSQVEPVDVLTGGSPCQDLSHAGKRGGMTEGTRSNLWVAMREAIAQLRPSIVVWENVRGAYSAGADSDLEFCPGCMGEAWDRGPVLRALGRVLGDLSDLGYVGGWHGLRAADVGAPHGRFRVFVVAYLGAGTSDAGDVVRSDLARRLGLVSGAPGDASVRGSAGRAADAVSSLRSGDGADVPAASRAQQLLPTPTSSDTNGPGAHEDGGVDLRTAIASLLPTPRATDGTKGGPNQRGSSGDLMLPSAVTLLPTPAVNDMGEGKTVEAWDEWTAKMQAAHGNGNGHGKSLAIEAQRLSEWVDDTPADYIPPHELIGDDSEWEPCPECSCYWDEHDEDGFCMGSCGGNKCNGRQFLHKVKTRRVTASSYLDRVESMTADPVLLERVQRQRERLLPTPMVGSTSPAAHGQVSGQWREQMAQALQNWGQYADAIARWEHLTRPAPAPTQPSKKGTPQLSAAFSEWLMGLPAGWVTDVPGITRNEALKALGNGVVPQQAEAAMRFLLNTLSAREAA